jgi:hypothetical protein
VLSLVTSGWRRKWGEAEKQRRVQFRWCVTGVRIVSSA